MNEDFINKIANSDLYQDLPNTYKVPIELCDPLYPHLTFQVASLSQYMEIISVLKTATKNVENDLVFRGMADHRWELLPSIARQTLVIEQTEHKMVSELMRLYPGEFADITSDFDLLAKMQHYGLPTRLLDFSTNPLVALYFACHDKRKDSIARVVSTIPYYQPFSDDYIEAICGLCKIKSYDNYYLEHLIENRISFADFEVGMKYPLIAQPKYSNDRIKNQAAMFMVFANELWDVGAMSAYNCQKIYGTVKGTNVRREHYDIIDTEDLELIYPKICLDCKDEKNWYVTHEALAKIGEFREIDRDIKRKSRYVNGIFDRHCTLFPYRFSIVPQIKRLDSDVMSKSFCSILIDPKSKEKILHELNTININERFLFPELEYTAKYVKDKYWTPFKGY